MNLFSHFWIIRSPVQMLRAQNRKNKMTSGGVETSMHNLRMFSPSSHSYYVNKERKNTKKSLCRLTLQTRNDKKKSQEKQKASPHAPTVPKEFMHSLCLIAIAAHTNIVE